jgi:hypothetical protein
VRRLAAAVAAVAAVLAVSGCAKATEPFKDSPVEGRNTDPAHVGSMPDGFGNWAAKCDGANMVYTLFHSDSNYGGIAVVANDPRCTGQTP